MYFYINTDQTSEHERTALSKRESPINVLKTMIFRHEIQTFYSLSLPQATPSYFIENHIPALLNP